MCIHRMSQSKKSTVGCKLLCTWQHLQDMDVHYDYVHWINMYMGLCATKNEMIGMFHYNGMYIKVCHSEQMSFGHKITTPHWSMRDQRVDKMNESWIIEVNPQLYAVTESYKAVETFLEQLRPFLIHAKRIRNLRMIQKIISNPHNFDSSLTFYDISQN